MAVASAVIGIIGAVVSAYGSYRQGQYQKSLGEYQAKSAEQQADTAEQLALQAGDAEETSFKKRARAQWGTDIVNIAKSGVNMTGSPLMVMSEIAKETELEAYSIRRNAQINAVNSVYQGQLISNEAKATGNAGYQQGVYNTVGSLMQSGSSIYSSVSRNSGQKISNSSGWTGTNTSSKKVSGW